MIVYRIENKINNKSYIGMTTRGIEDRMKEHLRSFAQGCEYSIYRAFRKYGVENFNWEVIFETESFEELVEKEIEFISIYDSYRNGYNMTTGGEGIRMLGEDNHASKITEDIARDIIMLIENSSMSYKEISENLGVSLATIKDIAKGKNWKHLYELSPNKKRGLKSFKIPNNEKILKVIKMLRETSMTHLEISVECEVTIETVRAISCGKSHKELYDGKISRPKEALSKRVERIDEETAKKIIEMLLNTTLTYEQIAVLNNCNKSKVGDIARGNSWSHLLNGESPAKVRKMIKG